MASARMTRAKRVQSMMITAMMIEVSPVPSTAISNMAKSTGGKDIQMSTRREMTASAQPRK